MSKLTDENIEFISKAIDESNIKSAEMKDDLIDHFCCSVEEGMKKGQSFEEAYKKAYQNICPQGFDEIQRETVYLLTFKKFLTLKRLMYLSAYLSAIGTTTTFFLKVNHIAGGMIFLLLTALIFIFLFLPSLFINLYRAELSTLFIDKLKYFFGFFGSALLIVSIVFKTAHWPGATLIFLSSIVIINFAFFPFLFFKMYKKSIE